MPPRTYRYLNECPRTRHGDFRAQTMKLNSSLAERVATAAAAVSAPNRFGTASPRRGGGTTAQQSNDMHNNEKNQSYRTPLSLIDGLNSGGDALPPLRYRTDLDKQVIHFAFQRFPHSIEIVEDDDIISGDWNFFWMNVGRIRSIFTFSEYRLTDSQIINHFPNHYELTRKDLMYKNIKRYIRDPANAHICVPHTPPSAAQFPQLGVKETHIGSEDNTSSDATLMRFADCVPITYNIPNDLQMFIEEFKRQPGSTWIVKPTARSQGRGIFLINRISQLKRWLKERMDLHEIDAMSSGSFIVSKYVVDPLLIGGKKFDLRLYVLVTSFKPLVAYLHEEGFARFCATRYVASALDDDNLHAHLTNVSLQKRDEAYNNAHGGKWSLANLCLFLRGRYGAACADGLLRSIECVIQHSLRAVAPVMFNDKHCFELYGYDILIDSALRPHLIEVNASPSLSTTTISDRLLKEVVLEDVLRVIFPPGFPAPQAMPYWEYRVRTDLTTALPTGFRLLQE
ncbi:Tubulin-tyrosine ligase/Tubulin polyglutamylase [Trypanosoma melophagium]|uniref:Tubulin-tyrosine ligase/Tubulin polyglutamylase n=1 Tax=Trypanosoma melophagium TaxID=715481 RepID=UPI00351A6DC7|nr:Tubulin-tyrosine ligase/Tubulin polyglutamylase [Trypanosoma melophagium]